MIATENPRTAVEELQSQQEVLLRWLNNPQVTNEPEQKQSTSQVRYNQYPRRFSVEKVCGNNKTTRRKVKEINERI